MVSMERMMAVEEDGRCGWEEREGSATCCLL